MVLFKEDEARIKAMERQEKLAKRTKLGHWLRRLFKIGLVLGVLALLSLSLLTALSGNNAALKKGIEDYLTQSTGLTAHIGDFTYMEFFPELELDAANIRFYAGDGSAPAITVGKAKFSAGFFDLMLSRQRIKILQLENIVFVPELAGGRQLEIEQIALIEKNGEQEGEGPALVVAGSWGESALGATFKMHREESRGSAVYTLPEQSDFNVWLGALSGRGYMTKAGPFGGLAFHFAGLGTEKDRLAGMIVMEKRLFGNRLKADLTFGESRFTIGAKLREPGLVGSAGFTALRQQDIDVLMRLYEALEPYLPMLPTGKLLDIYGWEYDLNFSVDDYVDRQGNKSRFSLPLKVEQQIVRAGPLSGTVSGGTLEGSLLMDTRVLPAVLETSGGLLGANYSILGGSGGPLSLRWAVKGEGDTLGALRTALTGGVSLIGGEGKLPAAALDWLLGKEGQADEGAEVELHCLIGKLELKDGELVASPALVNSAQGKLAEIGVIDASFAALDEDTAQSCQKYLDVKK